MLRQYAAKEPKPTRALTAIPVVSMDLRQCRFISAAGTRVDRVEVHEQTFLFRRLVAKSTHLLASELCQSVEIGSPEWSDAVMMNTGA